MDFWHLFTKTQAVSVASIENEQPRLRPMTLICKDERLFLATGSKDSKVSQWAQNPRLECLLPQKSGDFSGYLRISGTVQAVWDQELRQQVADFAPFIYNYWKDSANPDFVLYEILPVQWRYLKPGEDLETIYP